MHAQAGVPDIASFLCRSYLPRLAPVWFGYPFADLSYWVGLVFTLGCVAWVVNGHYALFAVGAAAAAASKTQAEVVSAVAAVVGGECHCVAHWQSALT